jgi:hypothetical protein
VACPYFYPVERRSCASDPRDAMLPLGDSWAGICRAIPESATPPDESALRPLCNLGYARGSCPRFPDAHGPDAVRFTISGDSGASIAIAYVVERDHHYFAHGVLDYSTVSGSLAPAAGEILARQAAAYAESYRRRKNV